MLNDFPNDADLFNGFESMTASPETSARAVEKTRQALLHRAKVLEAGPEIVAQMHGPFDRQQSLLRHFESLRWQTAAMFALALSLALALIVSGILITSQNTVDRRVASGARRFEAPAASPAVESAEFDTPLQLAAKSNAVIVPLVAEHAPVIVASGGNDPIALGSTTHHAGGRLHIWDWTKGNVSRQIPEVEVWGNERTALSPDGKWLVWARGQILNLDTGEQTKIDLGGADYQIADSTYQRIGEMRFSPDGKKLAIHVTEYDPAQPGLIESEAIRVVAFPSGHLLYAFAATDSYGLQLSFSGDGQQLASIEGYKVVRRDAATSRILQQYALPSQARLMKVALSPSTTYIAAIEQQSGNLQLWEAGSGRLRCVLTRDDLQRLGGINTTLTLLRFSHDEKYLAAAYWGRLIVIETNSGTINATIKESLAMHLQWSADNTVLTVVTPVVLSKDDDGRELNRYPAVHQWDWQNNQRVELNPR